MTALRHADDPARIAAGKTRWLAALEQELKSRVGWADEAVSPFAGKRRRQSRIRRQAPVMLNARSAESRR
ncbi:MAG: hypothetical protein QOF09_2356 [Alphaproteobacteria bacterium]|jgi:hypothetical protein|nr:hypothetical protein [Alphaproteobacteria bacterium]